MPLEFLQFLGLFLLTHPLRGATFDDAENVNKYLDFYSRTPCEVRLAIVLQCHTMMLISTHAPLARCDPGTGIMALGVFLDFYSRTPCEVRLEYD